MMTVHEVSRLTGVTIRALQYYDRIGLLPPADTTEAGYRLYDEAALARLQQILLFKELAFPLAEIRRILEDPDFDRDRALAQQIELLTMKRDRLDQLIALAREIRRKEVRALKFDAFDTKKIEEYAAQAKASWGHTEAWREYEEKSKGRSREEDRDLGGRMMEIFAEFGAVKDESTPDSPKAQALVKKLQCFITEHYYTCTDEILSGLGKAYAAGGEMTENIDKAGGEGTAAFASEAIRAYCG